MANVNVKVFEKNIDSYNDMSPDGTISGDALKRFLLDAIMDLQNQDFTSAKIAMEHFEGYDNVFFKVYPYLYYYKALILYYLKEYDQSEHFFLEYIQQNGFDEIAFFYLGNIFFHKRQWDKALENYSLALEYRKDFREVMLNIGLIAHILGDEKTAEDFARDYDGTKRIFQHEELSEDPFEFSLAIPKDLSFSKIPVFINSRDRLECLRALVNWLIKGNHQCIYILDNDSTYEPLLDYYRYLEQNEPFVKILYLKKNMGHKALWDSNLLEILHISTPYVYTDSDVVPSVECPLDVLNDLLAILCKYPYIKKVGLGLKTDDITYFDAEKTRQAEKRFYLHEIEPEVYFGSVDTTFALYRNYRHYNLYVSARTSGKRMAYHMPWYYDWNNLPKDEQYYVNHANASATLVQRTKGCE